MNIFAIIFIFISVFVAILSWRRNNKILFILSIIITILIVIFHKHFRIPLSGIPQSGGISIIDELNKSVNASPFISSKWKDSSLVHSDIPVRIGMIKDFIFHNKPYQMDKKEILALLGKPDKCDELTNWDLVYWLGNEQGLIEGNSNWFVIRFDSNNLVSEYDIIQF